MNQYALLALQYLAVPLIKVIANLAIKSLKSAPDGIPKELVVTMLDAIATNEANDVSHDDIESIKTNLSK